MRRPSVALLSVALAAILGAATNVATGRAGRCYQRCRSGRAGRQVLLDRVRRYWVESVLERSLYHEARIELGMAAAAGGHPWDIRAARGGQAASWSAAP